MSNLIYEPKKLKELSQKIEKKLEQKKNSGFFKKLKIWLFK